MAQSFSSQADRDIALEIIDSFSRQCGYISTVESNIVKKLEDSLKMAQAQNEARVLECYRDNLTQITSAHFIYTNTCAEVSIPNFKTTDPEYMRIFVTIQKYRKGIRLQHSILNDCLVTRRTNKRYVVDLEFNRIESDLLREKLEDYKIQEKFTPNRTTYR